MPRAQTLLFELVSDRTAFSRQQPRQERHLSLLSRKSFASTPLQIFSFFNWRSLREAAVLILSSYSCFCSSPQSVEATDLVQGNEVQQPPDVQRQAPLTTQPRGHKCR